MDWFERITGFRELDPESTRARLSIDGCELVSLLNGTRHGIGRLELSSLHGLRQRVAESASPGLRTTLRNLVGNVRALHADPRRAGALFQVASQFNLLEMISPDVTPEAGVTRYMFDATQGPACAIAAGAATIYRNHFVPVGSQLGQSASLQLDALAPLGEALARVLGCPRSSLWEMRNGYALCTQHGLLAIGTLLSHASPEERDALRGELCIGLHHDVEVTDVDGPDRLHVTQAFCSALPVAYSSIAPTEWAPFARLVLEASYEATLLAARARFAEGGSNTVLLTRLGGGAFGNDDRWIDDAIERALVCVADAGLDVQMVHHRSIPDTMVELEQRWR